MRLVLYKFTITFTIAVVVFFQLPIGNAFSRRQERLAKSCVFSFEELLFRILLHVDSLDTNLVDVANQVLSVVKREELEAIERLSSAVCFHLRFYDFLGCGGSLVDLTPFLRRVAGSNPALAAT